MDERSNGATIDRTIIHPDDRVGIISPFDTFTLLDDLVHDQVELLHDPAFMGVGIMPEHAGYHGIVPPQAIAEHLRIRQPSRQPTQIQKYNHLQGKHIDVKYIGQLLMYALQFKIQDLSLRIEGCTGEMKQLEDALDNCIDNSGTYRLLDFRRRYTECGNMVLAVKEILSRIDKGYYPMQMQNSYVLQGEVLLEFRFLEERYELIKSTVLKDFDTYTSIINNNINRNARLLSIISLVGVVLNFMFGSLLAANPLLGIIGGLSVAGLSVGATAVYHVSRRGNAPLPSGRGPIQTPSLPKFHRKEKRERDQWEK